MTDKTLSEYGTELRAAFQKGSDAEMLEIIDAMALDLCTALISASDRSLTYAAPQIADLAKRLGPLENK